MISAQDVQFWQTRKRTNRRKPWEVRWRIDASPFSRSFLTKALAENFRNDLVTAARAGEVFSLTSGEPVSWQRSAETFYAHARAYVAMRWKDMPGGTRRCIVSMLVPVVLAFLDARKASRNRPPLRLLGEALTRWAFNPATWNTQPPAEIAAALDWIANTSRPVAELAETATVREVLSALGVNRNERKAAAKTLARRRGVWHGCLEYAVERKLLAANPLTGLKVQRARVTDEVDPRTVPNLDQARRLLRAVASLTAIHDRGKHLAAFFAVMYYAGLRPAEVRNLRAADLTLPASGWGRALLSGSMPETGAQWTDDGAAHERRELKHRAANDTRSVPLPPPLVAILRAHIATWGSAPDGRIFFDGPDQAPVSNTAYYQIWQRARRSALTPAEMACGLAKRPYDLRHGNASLLLTAGVAATEVARRLGHSVAVLLSTYAHWFKGLEEKGNAAIDRALDDDKPLTSENPGGGPATGQDSSRQTG